MQDFTDHTTFGVTTPLLDDYVLPHPLNIEIYGLKFDSLHLYHASIYAIELDSGKMVQNHARKLGHKQDIRPKSKTVPAKSGHLEPMS